MNASGMLQLASNLLPNTVCPLTSLKELMCRRVNAVIGDPISPEGHRDSMVELFLSSIVNLVIEMRLDAV